MSTDAQLDSEHDLEIRVRRIIAECQRLPIESVTNNKTFEELGIDSLSSVSIAFDLESEFHVDIPEEALESIQSVHAAIDGIRDLLQKEYLV